ncbi:hypothetical protein lacNasYZ03_07100 [Lactobacillus nasalidis]|uniref:GH18 domain-containing protein n=1 Tax=Lactobacillus nasalidis TaxID=2797258 RepID=A0ABQ3W3L9_9LACO|nr:glycosyl hydrolase family 18 protein [Lactobacillus nasalidis]GHV97814.1 hypothetical protein lacNasYZ01_09960 [Lactobacillus nasalidis]GHV99543.1 hypothetical protein lacNasYZ02_09730 [Lactobacillus nasalidis]GHW01023.1 hypothetical protein lacNasYZ03_07100 [Lactobacillus nasalidis]
MKKLSKFLALASLFFLLGGCSQKKQTKTTQIKSSQTSKPAKVSGTMGKLSQGRQLFVWTVYWDIDQPWKTIKSESQNIDGIGAFAALYDENKNYQLFLADGSKTLAKSLKSTSKTSKIKRYMTVVNDTRTVDKSTDLLESLLSTKSKAQKHAKEVVALAKKYNFTGVEIDYEQIRDNTSLWKKFLVFEKALYALCKKNKLDLRIVLEPSTPVSKIKFPKGPEYVVMCYNLYGYGTNPGPKANYKFLKKTVKDFSSLGNVSYALSNGGFDFNGDEVVSVTSDEVAQLRKKYKAKVTRDKNSGALYFKYGSHTVWYADQQTLLSWAQALDKASGHKVGISIWRME